ncbi:MAG: GIY-YIG nuclease family protein [Patescibacteria group bacterium]
MFYVYVLKSLDTNKMYIGQTNNLEERLLRHNDPSIGKGSYTKLQGHKWEIVYNEEYGSREEALKREKILKSHKGRDWLREKLHGAVAQW